MKKDNLIIGGKYWSMKHWRWIWYKGVDNGSYRFEDIAGERFKLTAADLAKLSTKSWR